MTHEQLPSAFGWSSFCQIQCFVCSTSLPAIRSWEMRRREPQRGKSPAQENMYVYQRSGHAGVRCVHVLYVRMYVTVQGSTNSGTGVCQMLLCYAQVWAFLLVKKAETLALIWLKFTFLRPVFLAIHMPSFSCDPYTHNNVMSFPSILWRKVHVLYDRLFPRKEWRH